MKIYSAQLKGTTTVATGSNVSLTGSFSGSIAGIDINATNQFTASTSTRLTNIEIISASNINRISSLETKSASVDISISNINAVTASNIARLSNLETKSSSVDISITNINSFTASNGNTSLNSKTGSYATTGSNTFFGTQTYSGSVYIANDLVVQGSSSIQYISASSVSIGTNIVQLNTATPSVRFAGLSVIDSGSIGGSGSFLYDSVQDEFIFVHRGNGTNVTSSHFVMGPETFDNLGNELYLTCNTLTKGTGKEHLVDSCIFDNGTTTCIKNNLIGTGTACFTGRICSPSITTDVVSTIGSSFASPSAAGLGYGIFGYSGVGLGISATATGPNQGIGFFTCGDFERMRIVTSGNVGVGTSCPVRKMDIVATGEQLRLSYDGSTTYTDFRNDSAGGLLVNTSGPYIINYIAGCSKMRIDASAICFSCQVCTPNLISTDTTHTTIRVGCTIVPLANYRTSDCGYGGVDFFDNGKGYVCAAKFYTFKTTAEYYGLTNDYNGSAQLALISCGAGSGNNVSFFTGTSTTARLRIDNNVSCFSQTVCAPLLVGRASSQQIMAIGDESDIWMCNTGGGAGSWRLLGSTGNTTKLFRIYDNNVGSNRLTINTDGLVCTPFGVKFGNGSGQLNYYEEGNWTPSLQQATVSYDFRSGSYVRIGNYVFARWGFRISSISGQSGTVTISGLPFVATNWGSYQEPNVSVSTGNLATGDYAQRARLYKGGNDANLYGRIADNGDTSWNTSQLQNNSWIIGEIFYNI